MAKKRRKRSNDILRQIDCMYLSFYYFSMFAKENEKMNSKLLILYSNLGKITKMYENRLPLLFSTIIEPVQKFEKSKKDSTVDYLLVSINVVAEYYEQLKGKKKYFFPMGYNNIVTLQDELIEMNDNDNIIKNSFDFAEYMVYYLLDRERTPLIEQKEL